ncbi:MAG TPA: hypothetical protein VMH36_22130 [Alphaproteobacteria bacterium]|nr:hypothetical protein [Alphaproteobacteria bacterium]
MAGRFEGHCWKDVVSPDVLEIYSRYDLPRPRPLAIERGAGVVRIVTTSGT